MEVWVREHFKKDESHFQGYIKSEKDWKATNVFKNQTVLTLVGQFLWARAVSVENWE